MATILSVGWRRRTARHGRLGAVNEAESCRLVSVVLLSLLLLLGWCPCTVLAGKDKETPAPIIGGGGVVGVFPPSFAPGPGGGADDDQGGDMNEPTAAPSLRLPTPGQDGGGAGGLDGQYYAVALPQMHFTFTLRDESAAAATVTAAQSTESTSFSATTEEVNASTTTSATPNNVSSSPSSSSFANASSLPRTSLLLSTLEGFFQDFLKQSASQHRDTLFRVDLNVTEWQEEEVTTTTATSNLDGNSIRAFAVDCEGWAIFVSAAEANTSSSSSSTSDASTATSTATSSTGTPPTSDDLTKAIITYFSFWGLSELQTYLYEHANWTVTTVSVAVNGDVVQPASGTADGDGTDDSNANDGPSNSQDATDAANHKRNVAIATVVSVVAVLLLAGALWIVVRRRCKNRKSATSNRNNKRADLDSDNGYGPDGYDDDDDGFTHESHSPQQSHDVGNRYDYSPPFKSLDPHHPLRIVGPASASESPPRDVTGSPTPYAISDDLMSYSGIVSVEDSVFTSAAGTNASNSPDRPFAYDARRLDHVILSARGFTERHEREELQQQQQQQEQNQTRQQQEQSSLQRQRSVGGPTPPAPVDAASAAASI